MLTIAVNGLIKMGLFQKNSIGSPLYDEVLKSSYKEVWILEKTRTKRFIRSEAKSKLFARTKLYINKNEKGKN